MKFLFKLPSVCRTCNELFMYSHLLTFAKTDKFDLFFDRDVTKPFLDLLEQTNTNIKRVDDISGYDFDNPDICDLYAQINKLHNEELLQQVIKFPQHIIDKYENMRGKTCIHIRLGDYLMLDWLFPILTQTQIRHFIEKYDITSNIIVVTDDIKKSISICENILPSDTIYQSDGVLEDLYVITISDLTLCSSSSFSIMGCMLNKNKNKKCVIYTPYYMNNKGTDEIIPKYFERIDRRYVEYNANKKITCVFLTSSINNERFTNVLTQAKKLQDNGLYDVYIKLHGKTKYFTAKNNLFDIEENKWYFERESVKNCLSNFYDIIENAYKTEKEFLLCFEDDVCITSDFFKVLYNIPKDADIVKFRATNLNLAKEGNNYISFNNEFFNRWVSQGIEYPYCGGSSECFLMNRMGMKYYLDFIDEFGNVPSDYPMLYPNYFNNDIKILVPKIEYNDLFVKSQFFKTTIF